MKELTYTMQGDYQIPELTMPAQKEATSGRYAQMRKKFLKQAHRVLYYNLLTTCKMNEHLTEVEQRATEMEEQLIKEMAAKEGLTEQMKATDMMGWVRKMNSIKNTAQEIVIAKVIHA